MPSNPYFYWGLAVGAFVALGVYRSMFADDERS